MPLLATVTNPYQHPGTSKTNPLAGIKSTYTATACPYEKLCPSSVIKYVTGAALPTAQRSAENGPETSQQSTATEQETEQHEIPTQRQLATAGKVRWQGPEGVGLARAKRGRQLGRSGPRSLQGLPRDKGLRS